MPRRRAARPNRRAPPSARVPAPPRPRPQTAPVYVAPAPAPRRRQPRRPATSGPGRSPVRQPLADGVIEQDGEVVLARGVAPATDPALMLRAAAAAAGAGLPLAPHTLERFVAEAAPLPEPWPTEVRDGLVALLGAGAGAVPVFEALDQAGLVVRLLPEWAQVRSKPQRNAYHRFTLDRHLYEAAAHAASYRCRSRVKR